MPKPYTYKFEKDRNQKPKVKYGNHNRVVADAIRQLEKEGMAYVMTKDHIKELEAIFNLEVIGNDSPYLLRLIKEEYVDG